jgi:hypothetical protein
MWLYHDSPFEPIELDPKKIYGFVYLIENLVNGRKYVGKKLFFFKGFKTVKKKKKRILVESDWKTYYGSSNALQKDINEIGKINFRRVILHLCTSKSECSYLEMKEQVERNAILSDGYYNDQIRVRVTRVQLTKYRKSLLVNTVE